MCNMGALATQLCGRVDSNQADPIARSNIINNVYIKGPNTNSALKVIRAFQSFGGMHADSRCYRAGNRAIGFSYSDSNQANLCQQETGVSASFFSPTEPIAAAMPAGLDTSADWMDVSGNKVADFLQLMASTVGPRPGDRTAGRESTVSQHMLNNYAGSGARGKIIDTQDDPTVGGYFPVTVSTVTDWHAALPVTPNAVYTSGSYSDGKSRIGRTHLEAWAYEQHLHVL
jgi:hypothetical protein